jgi:hypothetical protein
MFVVPRLDHGHDWRGGLEAGPVYTPADVPTGWDVLSIVAAILVQILLAVCLSEHPSIKVECTITNVHGSASNCDLEFMAQDPCCSMAQV